MKILFVCEGNVNRSQMAATMLKSFTPHIDVTTAGVQPDHPGELVSQVSKDGIIVMQQLGFDMSSNVITKLTPAMVDKADKVILMGSLPGATAPDYLKNSSKLTIWDVPDPGYEQITLTGARDMILKKVKKLIPEILQSP